MFYIVLLIYLGKYLLILYFVLFIFLLRNKQYRHGHYGVSRQELIQAHELKYTSNFDFKDISNFNAVYFTFKSCSVFLLGINYPRKKLH